MRDDAVGGGRGEEARRARERAHVDTSVAQAQRQACEVACRVRAAAAVGDESRRDRLGVGARDGGVGGLAIQRGDLAACRRRRTPRELRRRDGVDRARDDDRNRRVAAHRDADGAAAREVAERERPRPRRRRRPTRRRVGRRPQDIVPRARDDDVRDAVDDLERAVVAPERDGRAGTRRVRQVPPEP